MQHRKKTLDKRLALFLDAKVCAPKELVIVLTNVLSMSNVKPLPIKMPMV
jgi:hypothetical protein